MVDPRALHLAIWRAIDRKTTADLSPAWRLFFTNLVLQKTVATWSTRNALSNTDGTRNQPFEYFLDNIKTETAKYYGGLNPAKEQKLAQTLSPSAWASGMKHITGTYNAHGFGWTQANDYSSPECRKTHSDLGDLEKIFEPLRFHDNGYINWRYAAGSGATAKRQKKVKGWNDKAHGRALMNAPPVDREWLLQALSVDAYWWSRAEAADLTNQARIPLEFFDNKVEMFKHRRVLFNNGLLAGVVPDLARTFRPTDDFVENLLGVEQVQTDLYEKLGRRFALANSQQTGLRVVVKAATGAISNGVLSLDNFEDEFRVRNFAPILGMRAHAINEGFENLHDAVEFLIDTLNAPPRGNAVDMGRKTIAGRPSLEGGVVIEDYTEFNKREECPPEIKVLWCRDMPVLAMLHLDNDKTVLYQAGETRARRVDEVSEFVWEVALAGGDGDNFHYVLRELFLNKVFKVISQLPRLAERVQMNFGRTDFLVGGRWRGTVKKWAFRYRGGGPSICGSFAACLSKFFLKRFPPL